MPDAMPLSTPRPSVVNWHGCGSDPQRFDSGQPTTTRLDLSGSRTFILNENPESVNSNNIIDSLSYPLKEAREQFEVNYLINQLKKNNGNISKTADFIGMERSALHRKLKVLGIKGIN